MNRKTMSKHAKRLALGLAALALAATPSFAQDLVALEAEATMPDGAVIPMWGFFLDTGQLCTDVPAWQVGPPLAATAGGTITVSLRNCLSEPVSIFIPGQLKATSPVTFTDPQGRSRVRSFDAETAAGGAGSYIWTGVKEGTYLYHSGTHPQVQVQMGLYGALVVGGSATDATLVYSEIDPALHAAVDGGTYGTAAYPSTFDYQPKYFLINGEPYPGGADIPIEAAGDTRLRFVNAGLQTHVPTLQGLYMSVVAEDGNPYPHPFTQYGIELTAGKTFDAVITAGASGRYALYDRGLKLTNGMQTGGGMIAFLQTGTASAAPVAMADAYAVDEDGVLTAVAGDLTFPGVLDNDTPGFGGTMTASLVSNVSSGTLALNADGSFTYSPNPNYNGIDTFSYLANDGGSNSNIATVTITVNAANDGPVAVADAYDATEGQTLNVAAPGVLANDVDVDGDGLEATAVGIAPPGALILNLDGSFDYTPVGLAGAIETFDYEACDPALLCSTATVTITVVPPADNIVPFANDDFAMTKRNTPVSFSVTANDVDAGGSIDVATVALTSTTAQRGGTVVENGDGTVTFTPKRGFRGTDLFTYTVNDDLGATSNLATVRVNVVK